MAIDATRITADELLAMPDDGMRRELVLGELRVMMAPGSDTAALQPESGASCSSTLMRLAAA